METLYKYKFTEYISFVWAHLMNWLLSALAWYKDYVKCFILLDPNFPSAFRMNKTIKPICQDTIVHSLALFPPNMRKGLIYDIMLLGIFILLNDAFFCLSHPNNIY